MQQETLAQGAFIVIEGTDGSGKATQCKLLIERLQKEGHDVATFDFPQYDKESSYFIREYLNGRYGAAENVGPYTGSLFYALDRYEAAPEIKKALDAGKTVIANRFTGSNMAHQGAKFNNPEERKGFYLWLDAIEFQMLKIPRPNLSLVLRVPAKTAQKLVTQKEERSYTDRIHDIHESDLHQLQQAVEVYDNLCELFPKDFKPLDCVRNNELLDIKTIHNLIWETITPMLPPKKKVTKSEASLQEKTPNRSNHFPTSQHIVLENVSNLLAQDLYRNRLASYVENQNSYLDFDQKDKAGKYKYVIPPHFDEETKQSYMSSMDKIFEAYSAMIDSLTDYIRANSSVPKKDQNDVWQRTTRTQACKTLRSLLPVASKATVSISGSTEVFEELVIALRSDISPEAQETCEKVVEQLRESVPASFEQTHKQSPEGARAIYSSLTAQTVRQLADAKLSENHSDDSKTVTLTSVWPRNELDLVPDMLYKNSGLSLKQIASEVNDWKYDQKLEIFNAYMGERHNSSQLPGPAIEKAHYSWDLVCDYATFCDFQRQQHLVSSLDWQLLTPRYGYNVPKLVEAALLTDQFEECFYLSLKLYSILQSAGFAREAQYATLLGHKMRWKVTYSAREAFRVLEVPANMLEHPDYREITRLMHEKIIETHPLLAEAIKLTNQAGYLD